MVVYVYADMAGTNSNVSEDEIEEEVTLGITSSLIENLKEDENFSIFKRYVKNKQSNRLPCLEWFPCYAGDKQSSLKQVEYNAKQKEFEELTAKVNKLKDLQLFCAWWKYSRFSILIILGTTIAACSLCVYSLAIVLLIKYPDYYVAKNGYISTSPESPVGVIENYFLGLSMFCFLFVILFCGAGTANAAYFTFKIEERRRWVCI
jgi:hypothetical protein